MVEIKVNELMNLGNAKVTDDLLMRRFPKD